VWADPTTWSVIVTGGSSGLGAAVAASLQQSGARVVSIDRNESERVDSVLADLADGSAAAAATRDAVARLGAVDAVVCCAGVDVPGPLGAIPLEEWERIVRVNLFGTAAVVRAALPELERRGGRVVTVASTLGHRGVGDATAYCASKFGVVGFTRSLTAELRGRVGVTLLTPGGMRTAFFDDRDEQYRPGPDAVLADPADVAATIAWCLSRPDGIEVRELAVMAPVEPSWP
jgi:NAD(P)-dependent dehydrogenase (short-subunit alcohol dehydrogenase family)